VERATRHSGFANRQNSNGLFDDDIAVLKLNQSAVIGRYVSYVVLIESL